MTRAGVPVEIGVLGELIARTPAGRLDLGGPRQRAVIALLVMARGAVVPADQLIASLWGQRKPADAAGALQSFVSHLRRRLEPTRAARTSGSVLAFRGSGYALTLSPDAVDAWRFERLVRETGAGADDGTAADVEQLVAALELWRGPAYAEYADQPWAEAEIARLGALREVARERLVAARMARGESPMLVGEAEALVNEQPLREERWRLLVLTLYRSHRQGEALAALRRARRTLADELGIDPGPALRELEAEVLAQSPQLGVTAPAARTPVERSAVPRSAPLVRPAGARTRRGGAETSGDDLVDRDGELAELTLALDAALAGEAGLVLVQGPAGIGKSRLLTEVRALAAERGALVCAARGSLLEKEFGFGAVRQLFEAFVDTPQVFSGAAEAARSVFDLAQQPGDGSLAVLHGLYWLTTNLATEHPLVLALDDLQWWDAASLRFLAYLVRRLEALPVLVVAALRTDEPPTDAVLLGEIAVDQLTIPVRPGPLSREGVAAVVRGRFGADVDDGFVTACHAATSGNPLLLRQLLRALQSEGVRPDTADAASVAAVGSRAVSQLVLMRLARLPTASTGVARAVAVLGGRALLVAVARLAELTETEAAAAVATLARAEVLRNDYPLGFVHGLVADAVYRDIPPGERQLLHDRAAQLLHETGAPPEQVAAHLLQAPHRGDAWVVEVLRAAASRAADRAASEAAITYLVRALQEPPQPADRAAVLVELGRLEELNYGSGAIEHLTQAYEALDSPAQRALVAQPLVRALVFTGERGAAVRFARRALGELPDGLDDERQGLVGLATICGYMHALAEAGWRSGALPEVSGDGPGARMLAAALAWEAILDADRESAVRLASFAAADGVLIRVDVGLLCVVAGVVLDVADEDTGQFWEDCLTNAFQQGSTFGFVGAHLWRGHYQWRRGELREALQSFQIVTELGRTAGVTYALGYSYPYTVSVLVDQGDLAGARDLVERIRDNVWFGDGARLFAEAETSLLLMEGRPGEALEALDRIPDVMTSTIRNPAWGQWRSLRARALRGLGQVVAAHRLVEEELALVRRWGAPRATGRVLRVFSEVQAAAGDADAAGAAAREAVALLAPTTGRLEHARALLALAAHVHRDEAVGLLRQAADLAWRCDATLDYRAALDALAELAAPPPPQPPAVTRLTVLERQIVARYLGGANERDIASGLFLTPQTVRTTLVAVRERIGAADRAELRAALRGAPAG